MMCILRPDANDLPQWSLFDENCLVRHYSGELSSQNVIQAIWEDFGENLAITIGYSDTLGKRLYMAAKQRANAHNY